MAFVKVKYLMFLTLLAVVVDATAIDVLPVADGDRDTFRKVSNYFMVSNAATVRLKCAARRTLPLLRGETVDGVELDRNFTWTFSHGKVNPGQSRFISDMAVGGHGDAMDNMLLAAGGAAHEGVTCRVYREYRSRGKTSAEVECHSTVIVNMFEGTVVPGRSSSKSTPDVDPVSSSEVLLFLDARPASVLIVTYLILSAVALIIAVGGCLRLAGHKWAWEHREGEAHADGHYAMTRNSSMEETNLWLTRNSRYSSNASNISGLVFQTDSEGMARLLERLDHVEDPMEEGEEEVKEEDEEETGHDTDQGADGEVATSAGDDDDDSDEATKHKEGHGDQDNSHKLAQQQQQQAQINRLKPGFRARNRAFSESVSKSRPVKNFGAGGRHHHHQVPSSPSGLRKNFSLLLSNQGLCQSPVGSPRQTAFMERMGLLSNHGSPRVAHRFNNSGAHDSSSVSSPNNLKRRRSMLGVLPSGIGIGPGAAAAYDSSDLLGDLSAMELAALEKERRGTFGNDAAAFRERVGHHHHHSGGSGGGGGAPSIVVNDADGGHPRTIQEEKENSSTDPSIKEM